MRKFVLATLLLQVALVVQCTTRVKRKVDADGYIEDSYFQKLCYYSLNFDIIKLQLESLRGIHLPIPYMYPCENCLYEHVTFKDIDRDLIFYKYDKETDFFETKFTMRVQYYQFGCECHLDPDDERITKDIEAFKKDNLNSKCSKMNPTKQKAFEVDPDKIKACFHSKKIHSTAKINVTENQFNFYVVVQEIANRNNNTVTYNVLQTDMHPYEFPYVDAPNKKDEEAIIWCLEDANLFSALPFVFVDAVFKCGIDPHDMFFRQGARYDQACRDSHGFHPV